MEKEETKKIYKAAFLGDSGMGKTSVFRALFRQEFSAGVCSTSFVDFMTGTFPGPDGRKAFVNVFDTVGQDNEMAMSKFYLRDAALVLITFKMSDISTLEQCHEWVKVVRTHLPRDVAILLVGTHLDLLEDRTEAQKAAHDSAAQVPALVIGTSAKSGENIDVLRTIIAQLCLGSSRELKRPTNTVTLDARPDRESRSERGSTGQGGCGC